MNLNSTEKQVRKFGIIAGIFFGCLCVIGIIKEKPVPTYLFGFLAALGVGFILMPVQLAPVHAAWLKVAHFIGRTMTVLLLTLAYYIVIFPTALVKRVFGGRPLPWKPDKNAATYWVPRSEPVQPRERFSKRF